MSNIRFKKNISRFIITLLLLGILGGGLVSAATVYHGNLKSHVFHKAGCRYYNCKNCIVTFNSKEEAIAAGYRACKICRP